MQAVAGIPETGVCDSATWEALLGAQALQEALQEAAKLVSLPGTFPRMEAKGCPQAHDIASLQSSKGQPHLPCIDLSLG